MGRLEDLLITACNDFKDGNFDEAIKNDNLALVLDGKNVLALDHLGLVYYAKGDFQEAERFFKHALEIEPDNIESRNRVAEVYIKQDRFDEASQEQTKILEKNPENIRARVGLGHSYMGMQRYDDAIREYSQAIEYGIKTKVSLGWGHLFSGKKWDRQKQRNQRAIEKCDILMAYVGLVRAYNKKEEYAKSIKYFFQMRLFEWKIKATDFLHSLIP